MSYIQWLLWIIPPSLLVAAALPFLLIMQRDVYFKFKLNNFYNITPLRKWFSKALLQYCEIKIILVYTLLYQATYVSYILFCAIIFERSKS